jgi:hypothetical protein
MLLACEYHTIYDSITLCILRAAITASHLAGISRTKANSSSAPTASQASFTLVRIFCFVVLCLRKSRISRRISRVNRGPILFGGGPGSVRVIRSSRAGKDGFSVDRAMKWCSVQCSRRVRFVGEKHTSDPPVGGVVLTKITLEYE